LNRADLRDADLKNANLSGANLSGAKLNGIAPVTAESIELVLQIAKTVTTDNTKLHMGTVHRCKTTHCAAGWVCTLNPLAGALEKILGWNVAACLATPIPEFTSLFYASDEVMLAFLQTVIDDKGRALKDKYLWYAHQ
jgi:hypothetical protein